MGQCGCGDYSADYQLPGPDGIIYAFDYYWGCDYCDVPPGWCVYRFTEEEASHWDVQDLPHLPIIPYFKGGTDGEAWLSSVEIDPLHRLVSKMVSDIKAGGDDNPEEIDRVDMAAILKEASSESYAAVTKRIAGRARELGLPGWAEPKTTNKEQED